MSEPGVCENLHQGRIVGMSNFMARTAKHYLVIKAVRLFRQELEKAGLDNLKILAEAGISIVGTYLDMVFEELIKQMPELTPIIEKKEGYKKAEVSKLISFLKE